MWKFFFPFAMLMVMVQMEPITLVPKLIRRPTHLDHYLCRQIHNGLGIRSHAVTNLSGDLCRTYCRVIDRMSGIISYSENISPNFVRCGPYQARCVDGNCIGFNYNNSPGIMMGNTPTSAAATNNNNNNVFAGQSSSNEQDQSPSSLDNFLSGLDNSSQSEISTNNHQMEGVTEKTTGSISISSRKSSSINRFYN